MSEKGYASFLLAMKHQVIRSNDHYWFDSHPRIYMSFPFNSAIDPNKVQSTSFLPKGALIARFPCPVGSGRESYRVSVSDSNYDLTTLNGKSRNQTKRGLENCEIRELTNDEILQDALLLNTETLQRQGRTLSHHKKQYWEKYYQEIINAEGATIWGAFVDNELAAFIISFHMNRCENILIVRSRTTLLKFYPNNALLYEFVYKMIRTADVDEISIGLESIQSNMDSLDRFKTGMGFKKVPIGQYVKLHPLLAILLPKWNLKLINKILKPLAEKKESIAKLFGLLKWYEEQQSLKKSKK